MLLRRLAVVLLIATAATASGCAPRPTVRVDGSSTVFLVTEAVAEEFRREHPGVRVAAGFSGTGGGFKRFCAGELDLCGASRPIDEAERAACERNGVEFLELEVAFDGIALVVNPSNDWCDCLTVDQLKALWQPDSAVLRWSDLNPEWPNARIDLYGPDTDSGTFDYFTEVIVGETARSRGDFMQSADDNVLVTGVAGDRFSFGYFGLAYYEENRGRLKLVAVDGGDGCVLPTLETVREDTYTPLSRPLYLYVRKASLQRPQVRTFIEYYLARTADWELITDVGYVPIPDHVHEQNVQMLQEALGSFAVGDSDGSNEPNEHR